MADHVKIILINRSLLWRKTKALSPPPLCRLVVVEHCICIHCWLHYCSQLDEKYAIKQPNYSKPSWESWIDGLFLLYRCCIVVIIVMIMKIWSNLLQRKPFHQLWQTRVQVGVGKVVVFVQSVLNILNIFLVPFLFYPHYFCCLLLRVLLLLLSFSFLDDSSTFHSSKLLHHNNLCHHYRI